MLKELLNKTDFFKKDKSAATAEPEDKYTVDDLIVLERYDEARSRLEERIKKRPADVRARIKAAEVYALIGEKKLSIGSYLDVAEAYRDDGFLEKATAVLNRALRVVPDHPDVLQLLYELQAADSLEETRVLATKALQEAFSDESTEIALGNVNLEIQAVWNQLESLGLVHGIPADQLSFFLRSTALKRFKKGTVLAFRGLQSEEMFLVLEGELRVVNNRGLVVRSFAPGDMFGESTLLKHEPWPSEVRAEMDTTVLSITKRGLERGLTGNPDPRGLLNLLRVQDNDRKLRDLLAASP